jgi:poly-gamma-glutamate capsule biosynthesis protein CapA/YwtB (metallophosphatase superfamily)
MSRLRLVAVGDVALQSSDDRGPFQNVQQLLKQKDILFGNLEVVLSKSGKRAEKAAVLCSPPERIRFLEQADFNVVNVANNHLLDLGFEGANNTLQLLNEKGIAYVGASNSKKIPESFIIEKKGIKLGFLSYTLGRFAVPAGINVNKIKRRRIAQDIRSVKELCDLVVVSLHWGTENVFYPAPSQVVLAHALIDQGASIILGHHPHVVQGIERYRDGLIAYSLGNFDMYAEVGDARSNNSVIICIDIDETGIVEYTLIPLKIPANEIPTVVGGSEKEDALEFIGRISQPLTNGSMTEKWWFEQIGEVYLRDSLQSFALRIKKYGIRHFVEFLLWSITPFSLRCYAGVLRNKWAQKELRS